MGIKSLNKFIKIKCPNCISRINLKDLENKVIVIDTSIYLYRFASDDTLIENIYLMVSLFKQNNITPIFIFDGKIGDINFQDRYFQPLSHPSE